MMYTTQEDIDNAKRETNRNYGIRQKDIDAKVAKLSYRATLGYYSDGDHEVYVDPTQKVFIN